jgi:hypothetical protein
MVEGKPTPGGTRVINDSRGPENDGTRGQIINFADARTKAEIKEAFEGPLGSILRIYPKTSLHVKQSVSLFNELGSAGSTTITLASGVSFSSYKFIDTLINVVGVTTGYSIDIPIRIVRKN